MHVKLACPIVTTLAQVAVAVTLLVDGGDFLLGNDLPGAREFLSLLPAAEVPAGRENVDEVLVSPHSVCAAMRSMARKAGSEEVLEISQVPGTDSKEHGPPLHERVGVGGAMRHGRAGIGSLRAWRRS